MRSFCIIGGDLRFSILAEMLAEDGHSAKIYANAFARKGENSPDEALDGADIVICGIPAVKNKENMLLNLSAQNTPNISVSELFGKMNKNGIKIFMGGVLSEQLKKDAILHNIAAYDFFDSEYVAVMNAIPTAEGAVASAIEKSSRTVFLSRILVTGYGRCARALASLLKNMGAKCSATYRNPETLARIISDGIDAVPFSDISENVGDKDFIFNTVPALVFDAEILKKVKKDCVITDIASSPGGTDFSSASALGISATYCPSLPGRTAPYTAAKIIKNAIKQIL